MPQPFVVSWPGPGRLGMMSRPPGGQWLADDLGALRETGVDKLVCALTEHDMERLGLLHEPETAAAVGLDYVSFPITDLGVPDATDLIRLSQTLASEVKGGRFVVAHCFGGVGRSGLIVGATLIQLGASAEQAVELISTARGTRAPETEGQHALLASLQSGRPG